MFMLAPPLAAMQGEEAVAPCCRLLAPSVFFVAVISVVRGYFQGKGNMAPTAYTEVAEQLSASLLSLAPCGEDIISGCLRGEIAGRYARVAGFLTVANLYIKGKELSPAGEELFLVEAKREMDAGVSAEQRAALLALKRYGRGAEERRRRVMAMVADYAECGRAEQEEFYADIRFEFEYYG